MFPLNSNDQYVDTNGKRHLLSELFEGSEHDIEELEETVAGHTTKIGTLETLTGSLQDQINPDEYSEDEAYTAGDYVIHGNKLYKCNTSCTADSWENNSQYFTETNIADELITKQNKTWTYLKTVTGGAATSFDSGYSEYLFICGTPFYKSIYTVPDGVNAPNIIFSIQSQSMLLHLNCLGHQIQIITAMQDGADNTTNAQIIIYGR